MATVRSSTFTGSDAAAWTLDSGSWTHTTEYGTFSVGPTEDIRSNKGRANGTATVTAVRRHHAGTSTFENLEIQANVVRSNLNTKPGIIFRATSSSATSTFYLLQVEAFSGKSTTYGVALYKCVAGTYTQLASDSGVTGFGTLSNTLYLAARITTLPNGNARISCKAWATGSSEPGWVYASGDTAGAGGATGTDTFSIIDDTTTLKNTAGLVGLYTEVDSASAYQADFDDFYVYDFSWAQALGAPLLTGAESVRAPSVTTTTPLGAPVITGAETLYAPTIVQQQFVTVPVLSAPESVLAPTVAQAGSALGAPTIDAPESVWPPTLIQQQFVEPPTIAAPESVLAPTIQAGGALGAPTIAAPESVWPPTLIQQQFVEPPTIAAPESVLAPSVTTGGVALIAPTIAAPETVHAPGVSVGAVEVVPPTIVAPATVWAPTLIQQQFLIVPVIATPGAVYAPGVSTFVPVDGTDSRFLIVRLWTHDATVLTAVRHTATLEDSAPTLTTTGRHLASVFTPHAVEALSS